jgi:uncharacterized protein
MKSTRPLAIVTGASSGIGLELAREAATRGYDLIIAADEPLDTAAQSLRALGAQVEAVQTDLATRDGVEQLFSTASGRDIDALLANAGHGLGKGFLDQEFAEVQHVINTNITGTLDLIQKVARQMRRRMQGKILITGSIAGFMPGTFQAVYNGSKAFIDSFSAALGNEIKDSGVTVTCLKPGATETEFFHRAEMEDTKVGQAKKDDPADVAKTGWDAMNKGEPAAIHGLKNKLQVAAAGVMSDATTAKLHRKQAEPGSGEE